MGKLIWEGWQTSVDDAAQPTTGIVFGANLRSQAEIDGPNYDRRNDFVLALLEKARDYQSPNETNLLHKCQKR